MSNDSNSGASVTIREASDADIPRLLEVIRAAFAEYDGRLDPPSSAQRKTVEVVREEIADGGAFVALADDHIVGCVFYHLRPDHVYLDRVSVLPEYRRQGVAHMLITAVEQQAQRHGQEQVRLSVRLALAENRAYYERLGYAFLSYGTHPGYSAPTFVTLQKKILIA